MSRWTVVAFAALAFAFAYLVQKPGDNERSHYALTRALAAGTATIDASQRVPSLHTIDVSEFRGHTYAAKAPGLGAVGVPPYAVLKAAGVDTAGDPKGIVWALHLWGVALPALLLLVLVRREAERLEPGYGTVAAVALGASTLVLPFASVYFSHVLSTLFGFLAFVLCERARRSGERARVLLAAGVAAGLAITFEYPLGIVAVVLLAYAAVGERRLARAAAYCGGLAAGIVPILAFDWWAFGNPFHLSYEGWHEPGAKPLPGVFGVTLPSVKTFVEIVFAAGGIGPLLVPAVVAAVVLWRRGERWRVAVPLAVTALFLLYDSANSVPFGGASPGPRYLVPVLPFLALLTATAWRTMPGPTAALAVGGAVFFAAATLTSPLAAWDEQVVHRLATGGYVDSVLQFAGIHGGAADAPFAVALLVAAGAALRASPRLRLDRAQVAAGVATGLAWAVLATQTSRLLRHGTVGLLPVAATIAVGTLLAAYALRRHNLFTTPA